MKKLVIAVLAVLFIAPAAMANNWGLGVKLGAGENDPKELKRMHHEMGGELDKDYGYLGLEAFHEWDLNDEANKLGLKVEWDFYGNNAAKFGPYKMEETSYSFPVSVYYKRDNGIKNISWFAGAGATVIHSKVEIGEMSLRKNKVFPHVVLGAEYRFTRVFALGLEGRYNFNAKVKKDGGVLSDRTGFGAALTGRFYF